MSEMERAGTQENERSYSACQEWREQARRGVGEVEVRVEGVEDRHAGERVVGKYV